jgi:hypothetical protein
MRTIRSIHDDEFIELVLDVIRTPIYIPPESCRVVATTEGSCPHCCFIEIHDHTETYVVKVPLIGVRHRWKSGDRHNLSCEAGIMQEIRRLTDVPIPDVLTYDVSYSNILGHPFILMKTSRKACLQHLV